MSLRWHLKYTVVPMLVGAGVSMVAQWYFLWGNR